MCKCIRNIIIYYYQFNVFNVVHIFTANILYSPLTQNAFDSSAVSKPENPLTVNQLARQLLPLKVTNKEIDAGLKKVSER